MNERQQIMNQQGQTIMPDQEKFPGGSSTEGSQGTMGYTTQSAGDQMTDSRQNAGTQGSGSTGADDKTFNLVSVLYHALEGGATYSRYIQDADQAGDSELAQFFRQTQQEEQQRAEQAKRLLASRIGSAR